jgi:hypothetical protein
MYADYLSEMTPAGQIVWEWRTWEHLDPGKTASPKFRRFGRTGPWVTVGEIVSIENRSAIGPAQG